MTDTPDLPPSGGTWERQPDGTLVQTETPTRRREPWEPEEPEPEPEAPVARKGRSAPPADPLTES